MNVAQCLSRVLEDRIVEFVDVNGCVELKESGVMKIRVSGLREDAIAVQLGSIGSFSNVKNGPWKRKCDYLILAPYDKEVRILFVELKRTLRQDSRAFDQLHRSLPLLKYICSLCRIEHGDDICRGPVHHALVASRISQRLDKQRVKAGGSLQAKTYEDIVIGINIVASDVTFLRLWRQ